jgi:hypothetical protein
MGQNEVCLDLASWSALPRLHLCHAKAWEQVRAMTRKPQELHLTLSLAHGEMILRIDSFDDHWCVRLHCSARGKAVLHTVNRVRPTADQIHARLDEFCEGAPALDAQSALRDLRAG